MLTRLPSWSVRANSGAWTPTGIEPPRNGESGVWMTAGLSDCASIREIANTPMIANNAHVVAKSARARRDDTRPRVPSAHARRTQSVLRQQVHRVARRWVFVRVHGRGWLGIDRPRLDCLAGRRGDGE